MGISGVYLLNRPHACACACVCEKTPKMLSLYVPNCARCTCACGRVRARKLESEWDSQAAAMSAEGKRNAPSVDQTDD